MTEHCEGPPRVTGWRVSGHGTAYAIVVCACGKQAEYVEVEQEQEEKVADGTTR